MRARGEEALGELAQALIDNPLFNRTLGQAFGAGERFNPCKAFPTHAGCGEVRRGPAASLLGADAYV